MRTPFVYRRPGTEWYKRLVPASAAHADPDVRKRPPEPAVLVEAHVEAAHVGDAIRFGKTVEVVKHRWPRREIPPTLALSGSRPHFERGVCRNVHVISDEFISDLDSLDEQIAALERARREMLEDAFLRGRPLRLADVRPGTLEYRAALAAKAEEEKKKEAAP